MNACLYAENHPARFWRPLLSPEPAAGRWDMAARRAAAALPYLARASGDEIEAILAATLGEGQFGVGHWRMSPPRAGFFPVQPVLPPRAALPSPRPQKGPRPRHVSL